MEPVFREFPEMPLVSISNAQRRPLALGELGGDRASWLPRNLYTFHPQAQGYLAFLGRISPEKRPDQAIEIAKQSGLPLRIAAKVDPADQNYFEAGMEPLLNHPLMEFVGEISDAEKDDFIGNAMALVCPYDWPEPFGLVLIEALACGTPVLAYRRGSIPEIIDHGVTGFICETVAEMVDAVGQVSFIDRRRCRAAFDERFTAERMARDYVALYERLLEGEDGGAVQAARDIVSKSHTMRGRG